MTGVLAANSAMPAAGYRKKIAADTAAPEQKHAAGVLFIAPDGDVLLLRRGGKVGVDNYVGHWSLPGGGVDAGETPHQGAAREVREEIGQDIDPDPKNFRNLDRRVSPNGIVFHTMARPVQEKFAPKLNNEHTGYAWAPLDMLPQPMHPAVVSTMKEQIGIGEDMQPEDWEGLRTGLMKWLSEEEGEPEHMGTDSALRLALDRDSVREYRRDGQLVVKKANFTKANICPYRGKEIPFSEKLGLDPDKVYYLYRDPEEIAKGIHTANGIPLLSQHIPVTSKDHRPEDVVGSLGTDATFDGVHASNSLFVNAQHAIDGIEDESQRELSAGYHYVPDMTPGEIDGMRFDGRMRDIVFNHVALVKDGRAGDDVLVADSSEGLMKNVKAHAKRAVSIHALNAYLRPRMAMDAKLDMGVVFSGITGKNFGTKTGEIRDRLRANVKLGQDAKLDDVEKVLDMLAKHEGEGGTDDAIEPADQTAMGEALPAATPLMPVDNKPKGFDAEAVKKFCTDCGMSTDQVGQLEGMFPKPATDEEDDDAKKKAEEDKKKKEGEKAPPFGKDSEKEKEKDMVSKQAMDEALKVSGAAIAKQVREEQAGVRRAEAAVKPWIGDIPAEMAFDSAEGVYRHALKTLNIAGSDKMHADALEAVLTAQPKPGARPVIVGGTERRMGMDSAAQESLNKIVDLSRIGAV